MTESIVAMVAAAIAVLVALAHVGVLVACVHLLYTRLRRRLR